MCLELLQLAEDAVVLFLVSQQVVEQYFVDRLGGLMQVLLGRGDSLRFEFVVGLGLGAELGQGVRR